jgi:hypothetical protein
MSSGIRARERTAARPLTAAQTAVRLRVPEERPLPAVLPTDSVPDLVAYRPSPGLLARAPVRTRQILQAAGKKASQPWSIARMVVAIATLVTALVISLAAAGEPALPDFAAKTLAGSASANAIVSMVVPITQLIRCDEYDSYKQCQDFGNAACSAAAMTEVFTGWGIPNITVGRMIDELGNDISSNGGLLTHAGFERVAAKHGFRADLSRSLSYNQILYIVDKLAIPLIVDVRISYGYYHFLAGGHFLVVTGGDASGLRIADSSEYYIHYLPKSVFYSMFTSATTLLVPQDYQYTLPNS